MAPRLSSSARTSTVIIPRHIPYRAYDKSIGDDLRPFSFFCRGRALRLTQLHTLQLRQELLLWLVHFELLQNDVKVCALWKIYQASWSISIDLDAQYVSSFTLVFLWKTPFKQPFMLFINSTSFPINNMSSTYTYQKCCSAPTHFLVNTCFTASLYKTICFDKLIKAYIPTPRCLHQSINDC